MAEPGITIIKSFSYRDAAEEWSNQYHLNDAPTDAAGWRDLADDLIALEKTVYSSRVNVVRALCYEDTSDSAVYSYILADFGGNVPGTFSTSAGVEAPGDVAMTLRLATGDLNSKGKMIYLRKYFHDVEVRGSGHPDEVAVDQVTALQAFGDAMLGAFSGTFAMVDTHGVVPAGPAKAQTYATTRTLKRRGRRP
jgi:hypothetical protein